MLNKIEIRNYSTNKKLDIEFGPNVTSLIGSSYTGKSAALRALKWNITNKPSGDNFINWDAEKTSVRITFDDNKKVIRRKGKGMNLYKLGKKEFKAFGNEVPKEIREAFNMSAINFQGQHDAPFWFCETAGEVSRQLNNIVNLNIIDTTLANIASLIRKTNTAIEISQDKLKEITTKKKELAYIKDIDTDLKHLEILHSEHQKKAIGLSRIEELLQLVNKYREAREIAAQLSTGANLAISAGDRYRKVRNSRIALSKLVIEANKYIEIVDNRPPNFATIKKKKEAYILITNSINNLEDLIDDIKSRKSKIINIRMSRDLRINKLKNLTKDRCPLCLRKTKKK